MKQKILNFFKNGMEKHWGKIIVICGWLLYGLLCISILMEDSFSSTLERLKELPNVILLLMIIVIGGMTWLVIRIGRHLWTDGKAPLL